MITSNIILLLSEAVVYFGVMAALLHGRNRYGLGIFVCALGVMHFLETYLAAVFYIQLPFGIISPGSTVLFSGKLMMILLLYIKEDALVVRQPIYGLLIANFLTCRPHHDRPQSRNDPRHAGPSAGHAIRRRNGLADGLENNPAFPRFHCCHPAI